MSNCRPCLRSRWLCVIVLLLSASPLVFAGKHPVALEKGVSDKNCLECHEDKTKGKAVHSAIAGGCFSCHEVRVNREITRVKLITPTPSRLCLQCHADKDAAQTKGRVHSPAVRDCLKCHDPHVSANKNQLLKPTSGATKDENLCLSCHKIGTDVPKGGSRHAALDSSCETCHLTHKAGDPSQREFRYHLTKATPQLCLDCHDPNDDGIKKAHQNQPFATGDCLSCHDPHQSASPKLMQRFTHQPFADKACDTCHQPAKDGKVVLTQATAKEICVTCHAEKPEQIEKAKVQHPGAAGDCTDCHNPHAGKSPGFPKPDAVTVCLGCHAEQAEQAKKAYPHQPAFDQGCATCHTPHGGDNPKLLRAKSGNTLCLECHGPDAKPEKQEGAPLVTIFDKKVKLPDSYFNQVVRLPLKYGLGHPVDRHPVTNIADPKTTLTGKSVSCLACHQPHSSAKPNLLVKDQANNMLFCASCHKEMSR